MTSMTCYDRSDEVTVSDEMCSFSNKPSPHSRTCVQTSCIMCVTSLFYSAITHAHGSRVSIALIRLCDSVCMSVCDSVRLSVRTIKPKRLKLKSPNLSQR